MADEYPGNGIRRVGTGESSSKETSMFRNLLCVSVGSMAMYAASAGADVVFDSFDADGGFHPANNLVAASANNLFGTPVTIRAAAQFVVGVGGFDLDSVTIPISQQSSAGLGNLLRVRVTEDAGGAPGTTLEVLSLNLPVPQSANPFTTATTFSSNLHPRLVAGGRYWIVTELSQLPPLSQSQQLDYRWFMSNSGQTVTARVQQTSGGLATTQWTGSVLTMNLALRVQGSPVLGACCNQANGSCLVLDSTKCHALGLTLLPATSTCSPISCRARCASDVNGSGTTTVQDLFDFLAAYFAGC